MKSKSLEEIKQAFKKYGLVLNLKKYKINIAIDSFKNINFSKLKPIIYYLLNTYEGLYSITIEGVPYCFLPDAEDHIIYNKVLSKRYIKKTICKKCKFFLRCHGFPDTRFFRQVDIKPIVDSPKQVVIELTKKCNQNCIICSQKNDKSRSPSLNKIREIIDEAKLLGIKEIRFTGGEPLLEFKKLMQAMKYAKSKGFYLFLNTNATLFNNKIIEKIENFVDNILISLQGFNSKTEAFITRRKKIFNIKAKNILNIQKSKIPIKRVGTIITRYLLENLDKYYFLLKKLNIKIWEVYRPMTDKNKLLEYTQFHISVEDILKLSNFLYTLKREGIRASIGNPIPFCTIKEKELIMAVALGARYDDGHSRIVFDSGGYFKPSYFIDRNLGRTIKEAWGHPFMKKMRSLEYLPLSCQKCDYLKWCLGGSRYLAKEYFGDYFCIDPWMKF